MGATHGSSAHTRAHGLAYFRVHGRSDTVPKDSVDFGGSKAFPCTWVRVDPYVEIESPGVVVNPGAVWMADLSVLRRQLLFLHKVRYIGGGCLADLGQFHNMMGKVERRLRLVARAVARFSPPSDGPSSQGPGLAVKTTQ
jgi:hypothetical protein